MAGATGSAGATAGSAGASGTAGAAGASGMAGAQGTAGAGAAGSMGTAGAGGAPADGGAGSGASTLVLPVMRAGGYTLEFGNTKFVVDPAGARIVEASLDGANILTNATVNAKYWGSSMWTAPESEWMALGAMYIVPAFDTLPFTMAVAADNSFTAVGPNTTFNNKTLSVSK